jgi:hypothetical protein
LWQVSRILGDHTPGGPFGKPLTEYSVQQLDFVLEMAAKDEPDKWTFVRPNDAPVRSVSMSRWNDVLSGAALRRFMSANGTLNALAGLQAWKARKNAPVVGKEMQFGFTRAGKKIDVGNQD